MILIGSPRCASSPWAEQASLGFHSRAMLLPSLVLAVAVHGKRVSLQEHPWGGHPGLVLSQGKDVT